MAKQLTWDDAEDIGILLSEDASHARSAHRTLHRPAPLRHRVAGLCRRSESLERRQAGSDPDGMERGSPGSHARLNCFP